MMMMPAVHHRFVVCLALLRGQVVVIRSMRFCCKNDKMDEKTNNETGEGRMCVVGDRAKDPRGYSLKTNRSVVFFVFFLYETLIDAWIR